MTDHTSIWKLARELKTYSLLLKGLCRFYAVPLVKGPRGLVVHNSQCEVVKGLLWAWKSRPKLAQLTGRPIRTRKTKLRRRRARKSNWPPPAPPVIALSARGE
jgi:hypothetical protein